MLISLIVPTEAKGRRLDRWLRQYYPALPQSLLEKLLRKGQLRLNGFKAAANTRLGENAVITLPSQLQDHLSTLSAQEKQASQKPFILSRQEEKLIESCIVWEDEDVLVFNKPYGLATQGGFKTCRHVDGLINAWARKFNKRYHLVHRLDRDTSGLLLIAKTPPMACHLAEQFKQGSVKKTYWTIVKGAPPLPQGIINAPLEKGLHKQREKMLVSKIQQKPSLTHYRLIKKLSKELTWLELMPQTGRTHQLRAHCAYLKMPIIGDGKYGGTLVTRRAKQLHLHARQITFTDLTGHPLTFIAELPTHMSDCFNSHKVIPEAY